MSAPLDTPVVPAPAPQRRRRWPWIVSGVLAVLIVIGLAAPSTPSSPGASLPATSAILGDATADVAITTCNPSGAMGIAQVTAKVTNSTATAESYLITVSLNDPAGNRVSEANGAVNALTPGQSATVELLGGTASGSTTCTVASVTRIPE
jgi:hypothetical protein